MAAQVVLADVGYPLIRDQLTLFQETPHIVASSRCSGSVRRKASMIGRPVPRADSCLWSKATSHGFDQTPLRPLLDFPVSSPKHLKLVSASLCATESPRKMEWSWSSARGGYRRWGLARYLLFPASCRLFALLLFAFLERVCLLRNRLCACKRKSYNSHPNTSKDPGTGTVIQGSRYCLIYPIRHR